MTNQLCRDCKHLETDGMFGIFCGVGGDNTKYDCPKYAKRSNRMTEKRFVVTNISNNGNTGLFWLGKDNLSVYDVVRLLNEFEEENEELKKQLQCSREEADDYCEELMGKDEFVRLYKRQRDDALKENEQLKSDNNRLVNETAKIIGEHQRKVFDLIDEKVDELEKRYKFGQEVYKGCPMHNIRFGINTLKELKKELQND